MIWTEVQLGPCKSHGLRVGEGRRRERKMGKGYRADKTAASSSMGAVEWWEEVCLGKQEFWVLLPTLPLVRP